MCRKWIFPMPRLQLVCIFHTHYYLDVSDTGDKVLNPQNLSPVFMITEMNTNKKLGKINALRKIKNCEECGASETKMRLSIHHKKPISKGGRNDKDNLIKVCAKCHRELDDWALQVYH